MEDRMRTGLRRALGAVLLALGTSAAVHSQGVANRVAAGLSPGQQILIVSPGPAPAQSPAHGQIVREIDDPHTGKHWLLVRDEGHPGGPGRLVVAAGSPDEDSPGWDGQNQLGAAQSQAVAKSDLAALRPVIRAGDRLTVEEHTSVVEAYLEAVALGPAAAGVALNVRLRMGGRVVRAVALGPGSAAFQPETGARP
jgi:hypothetical protein